MISRGAEIKREVGNSTRCRAVNKSPTMLRTFLALALLLASLRANDRLVVDDQVLIARYTAATEELQKAGKLVSFKTLRTQLNRASCELQLPAPRKEKLSPQEVYRTVRESTLVVGTFFKCTKCKAWHFDSSSGFVVADGVVSTCHHVVQFEDKRMREGYLVVADAAGRMYPVTEVLAASADADTCLLRVADLTLKPLALNPAAEVGERVFCLGHPDGNHWMFTEGLLSRYFINREEAETGKKVKPSLYINVTAEYSPGSSGAPIVDECGNVVGQVESITASWESEPMEKGKPVAASYGMPLRACIAAEEIAKLAVKAEPAKQ